MHVVFDHPGAGNEELVTVVFADGASFFSIVIRVQKRDDLDPSGDVAAAFAGSAGVQFRAFTVVIGVVEIPEHGGLSCPIDELIRIILTGHFEIFVMHFLGKGLGHSCKRRQKLFWHT